MSRTCRAQLFSLFVFRQSSAAADLGHDDEIPRSEAGPCAQDLQHHRQAEGKKTPSYRLGDPPDSEYKRRGYFPLSDTSWHLLLLRKTFLIVI